MSDIVSESFLQYIWEFQYFSKKRLFTTNGETLHVLHPGKENIHSGPDFSDAKILIGGIEWIGSIEIHVQSSDWKTHNHHQDKNYNTVILHVVWKKDREVYRYDETVLPTVELNDRISLLLLERYHQLVKNSFRISCTEIFERVPLNCKKTMLRKVLFQRLQKKASAIYEVLVRNRHDWEETAYQIIVKYFGTKINNSAFEHLARVLPLKILKRHRDNPTQIESLLFGQSGLLDQSKEKDAYWEKLSKEYRFLAHKYDLKKNKIDYVQWKFFRLRPASFPTVRIAQLASLLIKNPHFFADIFSIKNIQEFRKTLSIDQIPYWRKHYMFARPTKKDIGKLGKSTIDTIIINAVIPLLVAHAQHKDNIVVAYDRPMLFLQKIQSETNQIIDNWKKIGMQVSSAFDTQALIELYESFCVQKRCLSCNIGINILKSSPSDSKGIDP